MSQPEIQKTHRLMQGTQMAKERWPDVDGNLGYAGLVSPFASNQFLFFSCGGKDQTDAELTLSGNSDKPGLEISLNQSKGT